MEQIHFLKAVSDRRAWIYISRGSLDKLLSRLCSSPASTMKAESDAIRHLTSRLKQDSDLRKTDAEAECEKFGISQRGFLNRVWPKARELAGLPAKAPPGRKKTEKS